MRACTPVQHIVKNVSHHIGARGCVLVHIGRGGLHGSIDWIVLQSKESTLLPVTAKPAAQPEICDSPETLHGDLSIQSSPVDARIGKANACKEYVAA
jgi:hypothetical protein